MNIKITLKYYLKNISKYLAVSVVGSFIVLCMGALALNIPVATLGFYEYSAAALLGLLFGLVAKAALLFVIEMVMRANAASAQLNAKRAQTLGERLKLESKDKIRAQVLEHAKVIILQMHGQQSESQLETFFEHKIEEMSETAYYKVDRHLNYLTDRAIHGDITALKRLYQLYPRNPQQRAQEIASLLEKLINEPDEIIKLKDRIDTLYDYWKFRSDARAYAGDEFAL